jgi:hypothetical protein
MASAGEKMNNDGNNALHISRPEPADRALPVSYGDLCLFSCSFAGEEVGYLCEEGCVVKGLAVDMKVSSRELVFEVCTAPDTRAQLVLDEFKRKHGIVGDDFRALPHHEEQELARRTHARDMELKANEAQVCLVPSFPPNSPRSRGEALWAGLEVTQRVACELGRGSRAEAGTLTCGPFARRSTLSGGQLCTGTPSSCGTPRPRRSSGSTSGARRASSRARSAW